MAPRKASRGQSKSTATPKKRVAANGFKLPDPIPAGQVITDVTKNVWVLGKSIGQGGFGEIYLASNDPSRAVRDTDKFVVKVEPHSNGPLFTEMHCYMRIAKPDLIDAWMKEFKLKRFGMPKYLGSGSFEYKNQKFRFMVMERFGSDLQKILEQHNKKFSFKTVYQVGLEIIDVLEYIHDKGYIHADIKASNLLVGYQKGTENQVFLVDYGLACRYAVDGVHKEYKYDGRKAHDGTIEFTSRDAHIGAHSRRGDLEILGYNLAQWLCSRLPWEDNLTDCDYVAKQKRWYMDNVDKLMDKCFPDVVPPGLQEFLTYVASLTFDEKPDYEKCRNILRTGLIERGYKDDGKLVFMSATPKPLSKKPKSRINKVIKKVTTGSKKLARGSPTVADGDLDGDDDRMPGSPDMFAASDDEVMVVEQDDEGMMEIVDKPTPRKRLVPGVGAQKLTPRSGIRASSRTGTPKSSASSTPSNGASGSSTPRGGRAKKAAVKRATSANDSGRKSKKLKPVECINFDDEDDDPVERDLASPASDEYKENSSRRANARTTATQTTPQGKQGSSASDDYEDKDFLMIEPVKEPKKVVKKAPAKPRSVKSAPVKRAVINKGSSVVSVDSATLAAAAAAGFDNPTPAMLELIEKRNARLTLKKK